MKMLRRTADMVRTKAPEADLRLEYRRTFWACFGASSVALVLVILFWPSFEASAYAKPQEPVIIQLEEIPETRQGAPAAAAAAAGGAHRLHQRGDPRGRHDHGDRSRLWSG